MRQSLQPILAWDFEQVIMAHRSIIEQDGKRQFQLGYEWFLDAGSSNGVPIDYPH